VPSTNLVADAVGDPLDLTPFVLTAAMGPPVLDQ